MRQCDNCGEKFETLTRLRLHECKDKNPAGTPNSKTSVGSTDGENDRPWEVEQGLEPEYDCPDCEYYKTGLTTGPHSFLDHLQEEHDYSQSEAHEVMNG